MALIPVYTKRLGLLLNDTGPKQFHVPDGFQWVLRCIDMYPAGTGPWTGLVSLQPQNLPFISLYIPNSPPYHAQWQGRQVLGTGEALQLMGFQPVSMLVTGYEFAL